MLGPQAIMARTQGTIPQNPPSLVNRTVGDYKPNKETPILHQDIPSYAEPIPYTSPAAPVADSPDRHSNFNRERFSPLITIATT